MTDWLALLYFRIIVGSEQQSEKQKLLLTYKRRRGRANRSRYRTNVCGGIKSARQTSLELNSLVRIYNCWRGKTNFKSISQLITNKNLLWPTQKSQQAPAAAAAVKRSHQTTSIGCWRVFHGGTNAKCSSGGVGFMTFVLMRPLRLRLHPVSTSSSFASVVWSSQLWSGLVNFMFNCCAHRSIHGTTRSKCQPGMGCKKEQGKYIHSCAKFSRNCLSNFNMASICYHSVSHGNKNSQHMSRSGRETKDNKGKRRILQKMSKLLKNFMIVQNIVFGHCDTKYTH